MPLRPYVLLKEVITVKRFIIPRVAHCSKGCSFSPGHFERWENLIDYLGNVITFYFDHDDVLGQDGLKKLREWYRLEKSIRGQA